MNKSLWPTIIAAFSKHFNCYLVLLSSSSKGCTNYIASHKRPQTSHNKPQRQTVTNNETQQANLMYLWYGYDKYIYDN